MAKEVNQEILTKWLEVGNGIAKKLGFAKEEKEEVNYAEATLEDGTVIMTSAEEWVEGVDVFVLNDEGEQIAVPAGEYALNDGRVLVVEEDGIVASITEATNEAEEETEMSEDTPEFVTRKEVEELFNGFLDKFKEEVAPSLSKEETPDLEKELEETKAELAKVKAEFSHQGLPKAPEPQKKGIEREEITNLSKSTDRAFAIWSKIK